MRTVEEEKQKAIWTMMRTAFFRGLVIFIPVAVTIWFVTVLFNMVDGLVAPIQPVLERQIGTRIPGLGVVTFIIVVFVIGVVSRLIIGRLFLRAVEKLFTSIPLVRSIYSATRDLLQAFSLGKKGKTFRQVVLIEYPSKGMFTIGFLTNEVKINRGGKSQEKMFSVYVPYPPNPTSGVMVLLPESDAKPLDVSVEDALKLVLSAGIVLPTEAMNVVKPPGRQRRKRAT